MPKKKEKVVGSTKPLTLTGYLSFVLRAQTAHDEGRLADLIMPNGKKARECTMEYINELEQELIAYETATSEFRANPPGKDAKPRQRSRLGP